MKMKKNEDVSDLDIDKILTEKYDLGFLLDQIKNKKTRSMFPPSVIDALRFIPQFNDSVDEIKTDLQIDPIIIKQQLYELIDRPKFIEYLISSKKIARAIYVPLDELDKKSNVNSDQIKEWKSRKFPSLSQKVANIRLKVLGKAPHTWQEAIEDYILFDKISPIPIIYRKPRPEINIKQDDKTQEQYVEVRIYADTDIRKFPNVNQWKKIQKLLPAYYDSDKWKDELVVTRFIQYVLRTHLKLTQKQIVKWLQRHNLITPDYQHISQEVARFEALFISTSSK